MLVQVTDGTPRAENVFRNGSNALAKGRERLWMGHVRVGHRERTSEMFEKVQQMPAQDQ